MLCHFKVTILTKCSIFHPKHLNLHWALLVVSLKVTAL